MAPQIPWNFLKGCWKKDGKLPDKFKHLESSFRNGTAGAAAAHAAAPAASAPTAAQIEAVRQARAALYTGMVSAYAAEHKCSKTAAMMAVNATPAGAQARQEYLQNANPQLEGGFIEDAPQATKASGPYTGPDFQSLIASYRDKKNCSYHEAYCQTLRTEQGRRAHRAFLQAKNPGITFDE